MKIQSGAVEKHQQKNHYFESEYFQAYYEANQSWSVSYKCARVLLKYGVTYCCVDIFSGNYESSGEPSGATDGCLLGLFAKATKHFRGDFVKPFKKSKWARRELGAIWSKLNLLCFMLAASHLLLNIYHHYAHDLHKLRANNLALVYNFTQLERSISPENYSIIMNQTTAYSSHSHAANRRRALEDYARLRGRQLAEESILIQIGASNIHLTFITECLYLICLTISLSSYLMPILCYSYLVRFASYFARNLIDFEEESEHCNRLVQKQVEKFLASSRNHTSVLYAFTNKSPALTLARSNVNLQRRKQNYTSQLASGDRKPSERRRNINVFLADKSQSAIAPSWVASDELAEDLNHFLYGQLLYWYSNGSLRPLNRLPKWIDGWSRSYLSFIISCAVYAVLFNSVVFGIIVMEYDGQAHGMRAPQMLILLALGCVLVAINVSTTVYGSVFVFTCLDQTKLIGHLEVFARRCQLHNEKSCHHLIGPELGSRVELRSGADEGSSAFKLRQVNRSLDELIRRQVNANLLHVLMHFKIFVAQLKGLRASSALTLGTGTVILFTYPIIGRLHMPYFESQNDLSFRLSLISLSLTIVPPATFCMLAMCNVHSRCLSLYKTLASFLAHTIDVEHRRQQHLLLNSADIYDEHLIGLLRKELSHPDSLRDDFAIKALGIRYTYANVLKVYFWFGFIVISMIFRSKETDGVHSGFGSITLLDDPFGVF